MDKIVYIVGKPDTNSNLIELCHSLNIRIGLLKDSNLANNFNNGFDDVINIDFQDIDNEIQKLKNNSFKANGLICIYENYILAKAKISQKFKLPGLSVESAILCTDKSSMRKAFIEYDESITPNFTDADTIETALNFASTYGYPLILKPTNLVKSLLVLKCNNEKELIDNFTYAIQEIGSLYKKYSIYDRKPSLIIEEFIRGKQCSVAAFIDENGYPHFCDSIVELTTAQDIGKDDNFLYSRKVPYIIDEKLKNKMLDVSRKGILALKMRSVPAHVELMFENDDVKIIEIGARIGGYRPRMYRLSYGVDLSLQELKLALGEKPELHEKLVSYTAVYELFPDKEGKFNGLSKDIKSSDVYYLRISRSIGETTGPAKKGHKATAIIIVNEKNAESFNKKCKIIEQIKVKVN